MNVFLPSPDFDISARILDNKRLVKQLAETRQIIETIKNGSKWSNHPIVKAFKNHTDSLVRYGRAIAQELQRRNYKYSDIFIINQYYNNSLENPPWLGDADFHASHRSNLLRKGRADAVCQSLKINLKLKSINSWLDIIKFPQKNALTLRHIEVLEEFAKYHNFYIPPNYYKQFSWEESDNLPYVWP